MNLLFYLKIGRLKKLRYSNLFCKNPVESSGAGIGTIG